MPFQQPLPPKGDAGQTEPALALSSRSEDGPGRAGARGHRKRGCSLETGAEPCVYKAWGSSPGGLFSTTTPRLTWQHGEALPECRHLNPEVPSVGAICPMGPRLLLILMLLRAGEYRFSVSLPCHASPCQGQPLPLPSALCASCQDLRVIWPSEENFTVRDCVSELPACLTSQPQLWFT